jgi:hypothetical protein
MITTDDTQGLIDLFDIARRRQCSVSVFTDHEPHAERSIRSWCSTHGIEIKEYAIPARDYPRCIEVRMPGRGGITVYVAAEERAA